MEPRALCLLGQVAYHWAVSPAFVIIFYITFIYCVWACMWQSEDSLWESFLSTMWVSGIRRELLSHLGECNVYVHACVYTHICIYCACVHAHICIYIYVRACMCACAHTCVHTRTHTHIYISMTLPILICYLVICMLHCVDWANDTIFTLTSICPHPSWTLFFLNDKVFHEHFVFPAQMGANYFSIELNLPSRAWVWGENFLLLLVCVPCSGGAGSLVLSFSPCHFIEFPVVWDAHLVCPQAALWPLSMFPGQSPSHVCLADAGTLNLVAQTPRA